MSECMKPGISVKFFYQFVIMSQLLLLCACHKTPSILRYVCEASLDKSQQKSRPSQPLSSLLPRYLLDDLV